MRLHWFAEFHGPNPYAMAPVVVADLEVPPAEAEALTASAAALMARFPHWAADPAPPDPDPLLDAASALLRWSVCALNEIRGDVSEAGARRTAQGLRLWLGFHAPDLSRSAFRLALEQALAAARPSFDPGQTQAALERLWGICRQRHPDYQARILMRGARALDVPVLPFVPGSRYWQFGWGARGRVFLESASNADGYLGGLWQRSKPETKAVLAALGMPVPAHVLVRESSDLADALQRIGLPCVLKPIDRGGGRGVTAGIRDEAALQAAFAHARSVSRAPLMLEAHVPGDDHRLMVLSGRLVAAIRREPAFIVGNGRNTVEELVALRNAGRSKNMVASAYLRPIATDEVLRRHLGAQGLALQDVLEAGRRVTLRSNANLSTGGFCTDVTHLVHPQLREMAEQLAAAMGLGTAGLDYLTTDITRAPAELGGAFIEANLTPGLDACVAAGWRETDIAVRVLGEHPGRIPVDLVLVSSDALAATAAAVDVAVLAPDDGLVCGPLLRIGAARLRCAEPKTPWSAVHSALRNPRLQTLTVTCTPDDILAYGLPVDRFRQVILQDVRLPAIWLAVLERCRVGMAPETASDASLRLAADTSVPSDADDGRQHVR